MIWPLISLLLHYGEIPNHSDILLFTFFNNSSLLQSSLLEMQINNIQIGFTIIPMILQSSVNESFQKIDDEDKASLICLEIQENLEDELINFFQFVLIEDVIKMKDTTGENLNSYYAKQSDYCICVIWTANTIIGKESEDDESPEFQLKKVLKRTLPGKVHLNSCLYFVLNGNKIFEAYVLFGEVILRKVEVDSESQISTLWRRKNYQMGKIESGHAKNWEMFTTSGAMTISKGQTGTYQIFGFMQDFLNFTTYIHANKDWQSLAETVKSGQVDFGLSATGMIKSVAKDFRFSTTPTYTEQVMAYYAFPGKINSVKLTNLLHIKPFRQDTWAVTFLCLGLIFICHSIMSKKIGDSFWFVLSYATLQGSCIAVQNSRRLVMFTGSALSLILYATYSGSLISSLSTNTEKIYTIKELSEGGFTFGIMNNSFLRAAKEAGDFVKNSLADKIFAGLHLTNGQVGMDTGINYIFENHQYVFITEEHVYGKLDSFYKDTNNNGKTFCEVLRDIPIPEYTVQQSPILLQDSQFNDHFNLARLRMREFGLWDIQLKRRKRANSFQKPDCPKPSAVKSFDILDVLFPLLVITSGSIFSIICIVIESIAIYIRMKNYEK